MLLESGLDLSRVDVHATGDDHVCLAVADVQITFVVPVGNVAHRVEVATAGRVVAVLLLVVLVEHALRPDVQFAWVLGPGPGNYVSVRVEEHDLDTRSRLPA